MLRKDDFVVDWSQSALTIHRQVMGLFPGTITYWQGKRLKLIRTEPLIARLADQLSLDARELIGRWPTGESAGGIVLASIANVGVVVSSFGCPLLLREAQLEGKGRSEGQALIQQLSAETGMMFGAG